MGLISGCNSGLPCCLLSLLYMMTENASVQFFSFAQASSVDSVAVTVVVYSKWCIGSSYMTMQPYLGVACMAQSEEGAGKGALSKPTPPTTSWP